MNPIFVIMCLIFSSLSLNAMDARSLGLSGEALVKTGVARSEDGEQPLYPTLPSEGRPSMNAAPRPVAANPAFSSMLANLSAVNTSVDVVLEALRADHCNLLTAYDQKKVSEAGHVLRQRNDAAHRAFFDYILKTQQEDENKQQVLSPERDEMRRQLGCNYMKALLGELGAQESKESKRFDNGVKFQKRCRKRCRRASPLTFLVLSFGVYITYWGATTQDLGCWRIP